MTMLKNLQALVIALILTHGWSDWTIPAQVAHSPSQCRYDVMHITSGLTLQHRKPRLVPYSDTQARVSVVV
jgi:hypothetical protein